MNDRVRNCKVARERDTIIKGIPPKPLKEGSTFRWDFAMCTQLENTAANQAYAKEVEEK